MAEPTSPTELPDGGAVTVTAALNEADAPSSSKTVRPTVYVPASA